MRGITNPRFYGALNEGLLKRFPRLRFWRPTGKNLSQSSRQATASVLATALSGSCDWRYGETGRVNPKPHGGGAKPKDQQQLALGGSVGRALTSMPLRRSSSHNSRKQSCVKVSRATMGRVVRHFKLTRKKNSASNASEILNGCSSCEWNIGMRLGK